MYQRFLLQHNIFRIIFLLVLMLYNVILLSIICIRINVFNFTSFYIISICLPGIMYIVVYQSTASIDHFKIILYFLNTSEGENERSYTAPIHEIPPGVHFLDIYASTSSLSNRHLEDNLVFINASAPTLSIWSG
jgi:hypothetical protein